jgi:hypothetical protein
MGASRHTYVVVFIIRDVPGTGDGTAAALVYDGGVMPHCKPFVTGSRKEADAYCDMMKEACPEEEYQVIQLR